MNEMIALHPMTRTLWNIALYGGLASTLMLTALAANAQVYPARPLRLIVPFPAGGNSDAVARLTAAKLGERLGQQVVVDNRGGAGGNVGSEIAAHAPADGYTLLMGVQSALVVNPFLFAHMPFDTLRDFAPISEICVFPLMLLIHPALPAHNTRELIALAKARPGTLVMASPANGAAGHLAGQLFKRMAGINVIHVPYKGGGPALNDLIAGQVQFMFLGVVSGLPHVRSGRLRALATTGRTRSSAIPELPTVAESGLPGFEVDAWLGVLAPARTPQAAIKLLNAELMALLAAPDFAARLVDQGADVTPSTPQAFAEKIALDLKKWGRLVKVSEAKLE